jgi:pyruvate/2-oxoglutarate dehydrogenase complex dihydrolipoamide dehydrogenase (E3) component
MGKKYDYDVLVIGGGAAGLSAAKTVAGFGKKTAIIEERKPGGECTWNGCIPSKALIRNAHILHDIHRFQSLTLTEDRVSEISAEAFKSVKEIIHKIYEEEDPPALKKGGIEVIESHAVLQSPHSVKAGDRLITADKIILALGTSPFVPPIEGLTRENCLTNENFFELEKMPRSLIVLGGGPIGCELAQSASRLGSSVTIVEMADRLLFREDRELTEILEQKLSREGVKVLTGVKAVKYETSGNRTLLWVERKDGVREQIEAESLLCAVGRKPRLEQTGLETAGIRYTPKGITVNPGMQTSVPNIYACGDIAGLYQFSHAAGKQGVTAALNAVLPFKMKADMSSMLWITFTDPELARFGLTEDEARLKYKNRIRVIKIPYSRIDRAITESQTDGLAKFVLDKKGRILGAHILGTSAGEIIHEAALLRKLKKPLTYARSYIHAYPSYSTIIAKAGQQAYLEMLLDHPLVKLFRKKK